MRVNGTDLAMIRGDSESITLSLKDGDAVIPFVTGDTVYFTVKVSPIVDEIALQKIVTEFNEDGNCIIEIAPNDTKDLRFISYVYDIQLNRFDGTVTTIVPCSKFAILPEVTYD
jgi:hypothetical protein